jgi:hypothetical protein
MADGLQDAPRHAGQVVRRVLLRHNIAIDAETAQLAAPSRPRSAPVRPPGRRAGVGMFPRRLRPSVLTRQARLSRRRPQDDGAPGVADELAAWREPYMIRSRQTGGKCENLRPWGVRSAPVCGIGCLPPAIRAGAMA